MCQCELDLWPISPKLGHMTGSSYCINVPIVKFIDLCVFEICGHKIRFRGPVATGIAMATICGPLVEGGPRVIPQAWTSYDHPLLSYDTFLTEYVTWRCDLYLCPRDIGVMSRDSTWVINTYTKFEMDMTCRSRDRTNTMLSSPQKSLP